MKIIAFYQDTGHKWANFARWWGIERPGMGSQRVGHDWATEQDHQNVKKKINCYQWSLISSITLFLNNLKHTYTKTLNNVLFKTGIWVAIWETNSGITSF